MVEKTYNFNNLKIRSKAIAKARISTRPKTYNSKKKRLEDIQRELIKSELIKEGFLDQLKPHMPKITEAVIQSACDPSSKGTSDRRIIFQAVGILGKDTQVEPSQTIADVLAEIFSEEVVNSKS